jgi:hypothetical protein
VQEFVKKISLAATNLTRDIFAPPLPFFGRGGWGVLAQRHVSVSEAIPKELAGRSPVRGRLSRTLVDSRLADHHKYLVFRLKTGARQKIVILY